MTLLIDAYNVLKEKSNAGFVAPEEQEYFIKTLIEYAKKKKLTIIAVFDGGTQKWPSKEKKDGITIINSGTHLSADDVIKERIDTLKNKSSVMVVSSDKDLCLYADRNQIASMDSRSFNKLMAMQDENLILRSESPVKRFTESANEFDKLMEKASRVILYKQEDQPLAEEPKKSKLSKRERKLQRMIKKL